MRSACGSTRAEESQLCERTANTYLSSSHVTRRTSLAHCWCCTPIYHVSVDQSVDSAQNARAHTSQSTVTLSLNSHQTSLDTAHASCSNLQAPCHAQTAIDRGRLSRATTRSSLDHGHVDASCSVSEAKLVRRSEKRDHPEEYAGVCVHVF